MIERLAATPRPVPNRLMPTLGGALAVALALPVFVVAGWPLGAWALAAVLWLGAQALGLLLARLPLSHANLAAGVVGIGKMFRAVAVMVVLLAVAASDSELALAAAVVYALAYTLELALSLLSFFGTAS